MSPMREIIGYDIHCDVLADEEEVGTGMGFSGWLIGTYFLGSNFGAVFYTVAAPWPHTSLITLH